MQCLHKPNELHVRLSIKLNHMKQNSKYEAEP